MTELTVFGRELWRLMAERQFTLDELCEDAARAGYYLDDDVLLRHCVEFHTYPQGAKYLRGPAAALDLDDAEGTRLAVAHLFDR